jgi:hypothetical protein
MKCSIVAQSYVYDWIPSACFVFSYAVTRAISISNTDNIGSPHVVSKHSKPDFSLPNADLFFSARRKPSSLRFSESRAAARSEQLWAN